MEKTQLKFTIVALYLAIAIIFILGIFTADIYLFAASTVLLVLTIPIHMKHPNIIKFQKRLNIGSEVAYEKTFYISNIVLFYVSITLITLRNAFPKYEIVGYALLLVIAMNGIVFKIIQKNVEKEYLR